MKTRILMALTLASATATGCTGALQGGTFTASASPVATYLVSPCGGPVGDLAGALINLAGVVHTAGPDGASLFILPYVVPTPTGIIVSRSGQPDWTQPLTLAGRNQNICLGGVAGKTDVSLPSPVRPFAPEHGGLHVAGTHFADETGAVWQGRSVTQFLLCARLWAGESIQPQLTWAAAKGFNTVRVFGPVNWPDAFAQPYEIVPTVAQLAACFSTVEAAGLRIEYSALTGASAIGDPRAFVQRVFDAAAGHWGVFVEGANEPEVNGVDPVAVMTGVDRHGVLAAYGVDPERKDCNGAGGCYQVPVLDYATTHDLARDFAHSPRNSKDAWEAEQVLHVPVWDDEPIGVIDSARYDFHATSPGIWERPGGGSVRTEDCDITTAHAGVALILTGLTTYHFQAGLEGRAPASDEPIADRCAAQIGSLGGFIPAITQTGAYTRPGVGDWGLTWTPGDTDSLVQHAYASVVGNQQWAIVPMPAPSWSAMAVNGWRVDAVGPVPYIARVAR